MVFAPKNAFNLHVNLPCTDVEVPTPAPTTTTPAPGAPTTPAPAGPVPQEPVQPEEAQEIAAEVSRGKIVKVDFRLIDTGRCFQA